MQPEQLRQDQHSALAHWAPCWDDDNAMVMHKGNGQGMTAIGQQQHHGPKGFAIYAYRRNATPVVDSIERSNAIIGID